MGGNGADEIYFGQEVRILSQDEKDKCRPIISMLNKVQWRPERMVDVQILSASQRPCRMGYLYETRILEDGLAGDICR